MADERGRSPVHLIIDCFSRAVDALGLGVPPLFVERWGVAVHQALSSRAREFHTHQHVLDLVRDADAIETLAALFHDTVYVQVDLGVPPHYEALLTPLMQKGDEGWLVLPHAGVDPVAADVLAVFARRPGEVLTPFTGLNELASALVAAKELEGVLTRPQQLAVAACIEATIPFRVSEGAALEARLTGLGVTAADARVMARRATRLSNKDVGNFADPDAGRFLDNTWKLLPETNPSLHTPTTYSVRDYRVALMKMEGFLARLPAEQVFHAWAGEPSPEEHAERIAHARANIAMAVRYLRCKLYAIALVEALAVESGGDAPLPYFMGAVPEPSGPVMKRLEQYLPEAPPAPRDDTDAVLWRLLRGGRSLATTFDVSPSPLASYLYGSLGEPRVLQGVAEAQAWWRGEDSGRTFLSRQPRATTLAVLAAAAELAETRRAALDELVKLLD